MTAAPAWRSSTRGSPQEVQLDEHKLLIIYGNELTSLRGRS